MRSKRRTGKAHKGERITRTAPLGPVEAPWKTNLKLTGYRLPDKSLIAIPAWAQDWSKLSEPISPENFAHWWEAVKMCVLTYWTKYPSEYREALRKIGKEGKEKEYTRRRDALNAVRQALKSAVGLV